MFSKYNSVSYQSPLEAKHSSWWSVREQSLWKPDPESLAWVLLANPGWSVFMLNYKHSREETNVIDNFKHLTKLYCSSLNLP